MPLISPEQLDDLLPQTQCGLCGYGGCQPYAEAMAFDQAPINLCPPGGVSTLKKLAHILHQDASPYLEEMAKKEKPIMIAEIREAECIGCAKCIKACPVDAIIGSAKQMHTIITAECTGCELCIPPCPVDCIDLKVITSSKTEAEQKQKSQKSKQRYQARNNRLSREQNRKHKSAKSSTAIDKKNYIAAAIARAKAKKLGQ